MVAAIDSPSTVHRIRGAVPVQNEKPLLTSSEVLISSDTEALPPKRRPTRPAIFRDNGSHDIPLASMTVPLHAHEYTHHVYIHVGSPNPQRQTLILDTGSRYMAFPCEPYCQQCGNHHSNKFNTTKSTTLTINDHPNCVFPKANKDPFAKDKSCVFRQSYLEGSSWTAKEMEDMMWLATADTEESIEDYMPHLAIPFVFGCQISVTGHFVKQYADGILGMARALNENAFLNTMVKANAIDRAAFATCFTRKGGTLSLGGSGLTRQGNHSLNTQQYHIEPMKFTNLTEAGKGLYSIQVSNVYVGDICITCGNKDNNKLAHASFLGGRGALLDTGTTDTFFPKRALPAFKTAWEAMVGITMKESYRYSYEEFQSIPDITVIFESNVTLVIPATSYMEHVPLVDPSNHQNTTITGETETANPWKGKKTLTMRIYCEEKSGAVFGANALYHYDVLYDLEATRIGLARSYCGV